VDLCDTRVLMNDRVRTMLWHTLSSCTSTIVVGNPPGLLGPEGNTLVALLPCGTVMPISCLILSARPV
jgi:hypothetical protein